MGRVIGFMCAVSNCNNNSGANRNLSFFRFPSNPERSKLWLQACGIKKNISPQKLYNNYRVCSKHFAPYMFLNDLKNRLQPHAVPCAAVNIPNEEGTTTQIEINIETSTQNSTKDVEANAFNIEAMCSTTNLTGVDLSINSTENVNISNDDDRTSKNDKATQTESKLSYSTPRKVALRRKCDAAEKRARRAILKNNKEETNMEDITFSDFEKLLYKLYPKSMADFMKAQAHNLNNKRNDD